MDHLCCSLQNSFTAQPLDRVSLERKNPEWLIAQLTNPQTEYLLFDGRNPDGQNQGGHNIHGQNIVTINRAPVILSHEQFQSLNITTKPSLLGLKKTDNTPVCLVNITEPEIALNNLLHLFKDAHKTNSSTSAELINDSDADELNDLNDGSNGRINAKVIHSIENLSLREIAPEICSEMASMYSYASLLNHWHMNTRFCTRCGSTLEVKEGGSMQQCSGEACGHIEYPRINPAVIMRVTKGNKILLARQEYWPEKMYSVLAGFVEVGETLEHAVEREVMEEVNVPVENINYHSSQPWPFPNSFMLGYTAEATSDLLDFEQDDLEHAMWLTANELKVEILQGNISPPSSLSISYNLINDWFKIETDTSLDVIKTSLF